MKSLTFQTTRSVLCEIGATAKIGEIMAAAAAPRSPSSLTR